MVYCFLIRRPHAKLKHFVPVAKLLQLGALQQFLASAYLSETYMQNILLKFSKQFHTY